jgi:hypothetical protein
MPAEPLGADDFTKLLDAVKAAVAEALETIPALLDGAQARRYVGLSKSGWHRARSAGLLPKPVLVEGSGDRYRRADLDKFVERLKPRRVCRKKEEEEGQDSPQK